MKILLTNDDGINADGMCAFETHLRTLPNVTKVLTVAPRDGRSGCGHSVNNETPFRFDEAGVDRYAVDSWPADCVRLAILYLKFQPDLVLSGINHGGNLGVDILMSGTCSAAREAAWLNFPAIALSQYRQPSVTIDWQMSAIRGWQIVSQLAIQTEARRGFWNVNLPAISSQMTMPSPVVCPSERGSHMFQLEPHADGVLYRSCYQHRLRSAGTDVDVCFSGRPSITFCEA